MAITPVVSLSLDKTTYDKDEKMTLVCEDNLSTAVRNWTVTDTSGTKWTKVSQNDDGAVFTATAASSGKVTAKLVRTWDGATDTETISYSVNAPVTPTPTPTPTGGKKIIGMSSPQNLWDQRISEVGPGVKARRIFADLTSDGSSQLSLVRDAVAAGMMPVISYKVPNPVSAGSGAYNAWAETAAKKLEAFDVPIAVAVWHEPHGDMSPAEYVAMQEQLMPIFKRGKLKVGPILNGWLLDRQLTTFNAYTSTKLFGIWDYFAIDTYESGTIDSPGDRKPADRMPKLVNYLASKGKSDMPIGVGEYNGFSYQVIKDMGEALLSTPQVWFGCVWNSTGESAGVTLSGDRLRAFKETLADPRALD